ncbi:hypothetical protein CLCHR_29220 [Clostridium chromiireducens]|uniref:Uncharacterized protein n=1 Tax=Clostridium chromiireducens TaxID=225345 RepID=A0A1V4IKH5_9CLOT|nr:hypothetical protein CLCHR_29220 [Clostridium chromiireducens]
MGARNKSYQRFYHIIFVYLLLALKKVKKEEKYKYTSNNYVAFCQNMI